MPRDDACVSGKPATATSRSCWVAMPVVFPRGAGMQDKMVTDSGLVAAVRGNLPCCLPRHSGLFGASSRHPWREPA